MTLHRFFLPRDCFHAETVSFPPEISRQIERVLRLRPGDRVIALDGTGTELTVVLEQVRDAAGGRIESRAPAETEPRTRLVLYQGLLKGSRLETVLQKGTEVGVGGFVPVRTARSVPAEPGGTRMRRYELIVREAAEQSRRGVLPPVHETLAFREALQRATSEGPIVLLWEDERSQRLADLPVGIAGNMVGLFVGPEGGFAPEEVEEARDAGAITVSLGKRILRAETAGIVGAALVLAQFGDLG